MKRVLYGVAVVSALALPFGPAKAEQYSQGSSYVEPRGGMYSTTSPTATGGAAGYYVRDGVALEAEGLGYAADPSPNRATASGLPAVEETPSAVGVSGMTHVDVLRTPKGNLYLGLGGGGVMSDNAAVSGTRQGATSQADLGASVGLSKNVSLKAVGRYQRQAEFSDKSTDNLGANVGLKINF